jgi:thiaminase/transcriptional activator TenA
MTEPFHRQLRAEAADIWRAIFAHPFLAELGDGTLPPDRFLYFVRQDYLYLQDFARALCLGGAKADSLDTLEMFAEHAATVALVERNLHSNWSAKLNVDPDDLAATKPAPVTKAYTQHILTVAHRDGLAETVAAVLPCYWIYWEVGKALSTSPPADPIYAEWIAAYAGEGFGSHVQQQLNLIDRLAADTGEAGRRRLHDHFTQSSRYEYLFWDQAYRLLEWDV